jgi:hypothetical protein
LGGWLVVVRVAVSASDVNGHCYASFGGLKGVRRLEGFDVECLPFRRESADGASPLLVEQENIVSVSGLAEGTGRLVREDWGSRTSDLGFCTPSFEIRLGEVQG